MYTKKFRKFSPGIIIFIVDQSKYMGNEWWIDTKSQSKHQKASEIVNSILSDNIIRCAKENEILPRFFSSIIIHKNGESFDGFSKNNSKELFYSSTTLANSIIRIEKHLQQETDGAGGFILVEKNKPIWIESESSGERSVISAFKAAQSITHDFSKNHPDSFPPIIINITGGDLNSFSILNENPFSKISTLNGAALLLNIELNDCNPICEHFFRKNEILTSLNSKNLFDLASECPSVWQQYLNIYTSQQNSELKLYMKTSNERRIVDITRLIFNRLFNVD